MTEGKGSWSAFYLTLNRIFKSLFPIMLLLGFTSSVPQYSQLQLDLKDTSFHQFGSGRICVTLVSAALIKCNINTFGFVKKNIFVPC